GNARGFLKSSSEQYGDHRRLAGYWDWRRSQVSLISDRLNDFGNSFQPMIQAEIRLDQEEDAAGIASILAGMYEARAEMTDPEEADLDALVAQYVAGRGSEEEIEYPVELPGALFYEQVPYSYVRRFFSPTLEIRMERFFANGDPLGDEAHAELRHIWNSLGQPAGTYYNWSRNTLRGQFKRTDVTAQYSGGVAQFPFPGAPRFRTETEAEERIELPAPP
ncbi:MAG: hypothetical protein V3S51_06800, partial [Dehalococcoidia bacterium]